MSYGLRWRASAQNDVLGLDAALAERIISAVDRLANDPRMHGAKKLHGMAGMHRLRVGDYRVLYEHRREVYR